MVECGRKEAEKVKEYCILTKDYDWGASLKIPLKYDYVFALKLKYEEGPVLLSDCLYKQ